MSEDTITDNGVLMLAAHVEMLPLDSLHFDGNNVKEHTGDQVALLAGMMQEFGWTTPMLIDNDRGIIAGKGRYLAGRSLGLTLVPCVRASHLSSAQVKALILADNKINESLWDDSEVKVIMGDLKVIDAELLAMTGFDFEEIDDILDGVLTDECDDGEDKDIPKVYFLTVGKHKIELELHERDAMVDLFSRWVKANGSYRGAIKSLLTAVDTASKMREFTEQ